MSVPYYLRLCYFLIDAHCHATALLFGNAERISSGQAQNFGREMGQKSEFELVKAHFFNSLMNIE